MPRSEPVIRVVFDTRMNMCSLALRNLIMELSTNGKIIFALLLSIVWVFA